MKKYNINLSPYTEDEYIEKKSFESLTKQNFDSRNNQQKIESNCFCGDCSGYRPPYLNRPRCGIPNFGCHCPIVPSPCPTPCPCTPPQNCCNKDNSMFWFTFGFLVGRNNFY